MKFGQVQSKIQRRDGNNGLNPRNIVPSFFVKKHQFTLFRLCCNKVFDIEYAESFYNRKSPVFDAIYHNNCFIRTCQYEIINSASLRICGLSLFQINVVYWWSVNLCDGPSKKCPMMVGLTIKQLNMYTNVSGNKSTYRQITLHGSLIVKSVVVNHTRFPILATLTNEHVVFLWSYIVGVFIVGGCLACGVHNPTQAVFRHVPNPAEKFDPNYRLS